MASLEFWYEFASTYSYPAAMRIDDVAAEKGVEVIWRPFLLGPVFRAQGITDSPFNLNPIKGRYMVRDLERVCADQGLPFKLPEPFPMNGLYAARLAMLGSSEGWTPDFSRGVYLAEFGDGADIADPVTLKAILTGLNLDADDCAAQIQEQDLKDRLKAQTERAQELGVFGAPSFVVGDELFWGNDRLEQALDWARDEG